jgi:hypothetical protein
MNKQLGSQRKTLISKLSISCITLSLILTNTAFAAYKPPSKPSSPKVPTGSNGSRTNGCTGNAKTSLTTLTPQSHIGQTLSSHPIFAWFVPDSESHEIEFSLYEYDANGKSQRIQSTKLQSRSGVMTFTLPKETLGLSVGKTYFWQVALLCNPNHPSEDLLVKTEIQFVSIPSSLKNSLARIKEPQKRADLYAEAGFWYDALAEVIEEPKNQAYVLNLLEDLRKIEVEVAKNAAGRRQKYLQEYALQLEQIIAIKKQRI